MIFKNQIFSGQSEILRAVREAKMSKFISLTKWAGMYYENPPTPGTLRHWARNGNIFLPPDLHGREYRVSPNAFYIKPKKFGMTLTHHQPNGRTGRRSLLLEKLINETEKNL